MMDAIEALKRFVDGALLPEKARRYSALLETKKGLPKILDSLYHEFQSALDLRLATTRNKMPMTCACFVFKMPKDSGTQYETMEAAYEALSGDDSWLIVAQDGLSGIHRPEGRWDAEKMIRIEQAPLRTEYRRRA